MKTYLLFTVLTVALPLLTEGRATYSEGKMLEKRKLVGKSYASSPSIKYLDSKKKIYSGLDKLKGCSDELAPTSHSSIECTHYSGCRAECEEGFLFPNKRPALMFSCVDGHWLAEGFGYTTVPECYPEEEEDYEDEESEEIETTGSVKEEEKESIGGSTQEEGTYVPGEGVLTDEGNKEIEEEIENTEEKEYKTCTLPVITEHSRINCIAESYCELRCHKGYKLPEPKNYISLYCHDGEWIREDTNDTNIPLCEPEKPICNAAPSLPPSSTFICDSERNCEATCEKRHKFPSGKSSIEVTCALGIWFLEADDEDKTKGCVREMLTCGGKMLDELENAAIECDDKSCTGTCAPGYKFPNGNSTLTAVCDRNKWKIEDTSFETLPDCVPELRSHTKCNGSDYLVFPNLGAYKVNTTHVNWAQAQKSCIQEGSHLAVINSKEELKLMKELIAAHHPKNGWTYALIGFNDMAKRGVWVTVLGSMLDSVHYTRWAPHNPSKMEERCGALDHKGRLHDVFCDSEQIFICEKV